MLVSPSSPLPPLPPPCLSLSPPQGRLLFTEEIILLVSCCTCFILAPYPFPILAVSRARLLYFKVSNIQGWLMINLLCLPSLLTTPLISKFRFFFFLPFFSFFICAIAFYEKHFGISRSLLFLLMKADIKYNFLILSFYLFMYF